MANWTVFATRKRNSTLANIIKKKFNWAKKKINWVVKKIKERLSNWRKTDSKSFNKKPFKDLKFMSENDNVLTLKKLKEIVKKSRSSNKK